MNRALICLLTVGFSTDLAHGDFASDFKNTPDRVWVGSQFWANPMEDWSIKNGRLECLGGGNRNVALLTHTLTSRGGFQMTVRVGRLAKTKAPGSVGFRIGVSDEIDDYRAAALRGKGLDIGISGRQRTLFIGKVAGGALPNDKSPDDVTLTLSGKMIGNKIVLTLTAVDSAAKKLASVTSTVPAAQVRGLVMLVNNHKTSNKPAFWFSNWKLTGTGVEAHADRAWGPILWTMHTMHNTHSKDAVVLKMTAQLVPMGERGPKTAKLRISKSDAAVEAKVDPLACNATFRITQWDSTKNAKYTVQYGDAIYTGTIRAEPAGRPLVVAGFTGNQDYVFPNNAVARNVRVQNPDVLFFSGDQIYEAVGGYGIVRAPTDRADKATIRRTTLNYLRKWYLLGWAFGDLMRDRPTVCLPDDHDVYQGNIWGQGGINPHGMRNHAKGGFAEHPSFVNTVFRTQCAHHPDPPDPTPKKQGISVFYGPMLYGRVSFAILEDRYYKSGPEDKVNSWQGRPDHVKNKNFDMMKLDKPGLELLGRRQEKFLERWVGDWRGADFKCVLSQTIFCNLANYHGAGRQFIFADLDSNGWPQTPRKNALRILRKGYAFHYAGDQHLPSITQNGIDTWGDAGFAFCVPSIAAGYPRSWLPDKEGRAVQNRPTPKLANTGEYRDGFGNYVTVFGIANPADKNRRGRENRAHDKSSGHGIVRFDPAKQTITMECYRVQINPEKTSPNDQFPGWPKTIKLTDNRGQRITGYLPEIVAPKGVKRPVLRVSNAKTGELVYALRLAKNRVKPWIYSQGQYKVEFGDPETNDWTVVRTAAKTSIRLNRNVRGTPTSASADSLAIRSWKKLPDMPVPRWEAGTVALDGKLFVFGGYTLGTKSSKRADVFDPKTNSWRKLADLPSAITHMNAVLDGRSVWLAGGFKDGYKGYAITEVCRYDIDKNTYTAAPPLPERRAGGGLAIVGRRLHYIGGLLPDRVTDASDHWILNIDKSLKGVAEWGRGKAMPKPRNQFGTLTVGGKIYAIGGQFGHDRGQNDQSRVDIYDPKTDSWSRGPDLPKPHSHAEGSTFTYGGRLFTIGGMTRIGKRRQIDSSIWMLLTNNKWKLLGKLPRPLSSPAAAILGNRLYVGGGSPDGANPQAGMWVSHLFVPKTNESWTGLLGPNRDGWVSSFQPPKAWPKELKKSWQLKVGTGYGTPLVARDRVYQHARQGEDEVVWCLDLKTGGVKWRKTVATPFKIAGGGHYHGKGPKSSPVLEDDRLFTIGITGVLTAWDSTTGKQLWQRDTGAKFKKRHPRWGVSTSPIVDEKRLVVHVGTDFHGALVAFDTATGKPVWTYEKDGPSYSSPLLVEIQGVRQIIDWNERVLAGIDSKTGKPLWEYPAKQNFSDQNMPTPVFHKGRILLGAENRGIKGLDPKLENGKWKVHERWHQKTVSLNMSTAVMNDGLLYGLNHYSRGRLFCLDPKSGNVLWQGPGRTGQNVAFLSIPGHIVAMISHGHLQIIKAQGDRYEKVASYRVANTDTWAPPVMLKSGILVKDKNTLTFWSLPSSARR